MKKKIKTINLGIFKLNIGEGMIKQKMNENIEVSVILTIYNAEKYLEETLNSIENQTFRNIEIICVNDGSTDNSIKIIKQFIEKDNRIKLVDKKNEGVWKARLDGIKAAKGNYIVFIDSDDTIIESYIEKLYDSITKKNADISIFLKV